MNTHPTSKKSMLTLVVVIVFFALAYFFFMGGSAPDVGLLGETEPIDPISSQVIGLLNQIESLRIDTTLFSDPVYQTLRDYSVPIPPQNVGRPNPFAPVPGMPSSESSGTVR